MTSRLSRVLAVTTLAAAAVVPAARAAVITQTMTADLSLGGSTALDFASFDPTLGTLTDVTATLSGNVTTSVDVRNDTAETQSGVVAEYIGEPKISGPGDLLVENAYDTYCTTGIAAQGTSSCGASTSYGPTSQSGIAPLTDYTAAGGSIPIDIADVFISAAVYSADPGPLSCCVLGTPTGTDDASVTLQYTYTPAAPVPEPSSLALLAAALAILLPWSRGMSRLRANG
jgi:hypothetical protein